MSSDRERSGKLGKVHTLLLLGPVAVVAAFALYTFAVMWFNPGASISERGDEGLLYATLFSSVIELIAIPAAVIRMWRAPALRGARNTIVVVAGTFPLIACVFLWLALLLGLG